MKNKKIYLFTITSFFFMGAGLIFAQDKTTVKLPDLSIHSVIFDPEPKEGQPLGAVKILVHNHGTADAPVNEFRFECLAVDCDDDNDCLQISQALKGQMTVPAVKQDAEVEVKWAPDSSLRWVKGNFIISAIIDPENKIQEASEVNNINQSVIYLKQFAPETK